MRTSSSEEFRVNLCFKEEIEENNIFLGASLTYLFAVLLACLLKTIEAYLGIIFMLIAVMMVWYLRDKRKDMRRKYERQVELLKTHGRSVRCWCW
jgi:Flp pilus assembly protein TadB